MRDRTFDLIGSRVRVSLHYGVDSGKRGVIVDPRKFLNGRGVPSVGGAYKPLARDERIVHLYDGNYAVVPIRSLMIDNGGPDKLRVGDGAPSYNKESVDKAIESSNRAGRRIGKKEGSAIHRLLMGRHGNVKPNPSGGIYVDVDRSRDWIVRVTRSKKYGIGDSNPMMRHEALAERDDILHADPSAKVEVIQSRGFNQNGAKMRVEISDYADARRAMERTRGSLGHNTKIVQDGTSYSIILHNTRIVTYHADGSVTLNSGGYQTVTTKSRMNEVLPQFVRVVQIKEKWWVQDARDKSKVAFFDGMTIRLD